MEEVGVLRRRYLTYANVTATIAMVMAMTGGAYALVVTSADIKDNTIKGRDVKNGNLTGKDVKDRSLGGAELGVTVDMQAKTAEDVFSSETSGGTVASGSIRLKKAGDVLVVTTLNTNGASFSGTVVALKPRLDGAAPDTNRTYQLPDDGHVHTVTMVYKNLAKGLHTFAITSENPNDNVTFDRVEFTLLALP